MRKVQNGPNLLILDTLDEIKSILVKIKNFKRMINPYFTTVPIRGRQNHVVLRTFYRRNGKKLDMNILFFLKKWKLPTTC